MEHPMWPGSHSPATLEPYQVHRTLKQKQLVSDMAAVQSAWAREQGIIDVAEPVVEIKTPADYMDNDINRHGGGAGTPAPPIPAPTPVGLPEVGSGLVRIGAPAGIEVPRAHYPYHHQGAPHLYSPGMMAFKEGVMYHYAPKEEVDMMPQNYHVDRQTPYHIERDYRIERDHRIEREDYHPIRQDYRIERPQNYHVERGSYHIERGNYGLDREYSVGRVHIPPVVAERRTPEEDLVVDEHHRDTPNEKPNIMTAADEQQQAEGYNEDMKDRLHERLNEHLHERLNEHVNERLNEHLNERLNEHVNERLNEHLHERLETERLNERLETGRLNERLESERLNERLETERLAERLRAGFDEPPPTQVVNHRLPEGINHRHHEAMNHRLQESVNHRLQESVNHRLQVGINDRLQEGINERLQEEIHERIQEGVGERLQERIGEGFNDQSQKGMNDNLQDEMNDHLQERVNERLQEGMNDRLREGMNERIQEGMDDRIQEGITERINETISERLNETLNERLNETLNEKTGLMFSHSILEPEAPDAQESFLSSTLSSEDMDKAPFNSSGEIPDDQDCYSDRYRSCCPFCGEMFTHVIAHMMTVHSDVPLVVEAMSHKKGSPQRRALFIALKNKGNYLRNKFVEGDEIPDSATVDDKELEKPVQKVTCEYCSRSYKAHKIRYHYMKCSAYKESTNHNTFTFRREMRKKDHQKKCRNILESYPHVNEKVASEILSRMRQDNVTTHILNDPLLLKYAEVHIQGDVMPSFLHKIKQDLRNLGKLVLTLREKDETILLMADALKPAMFGLVARCVQEHSGFNSNTCSYERISTPMNIGYTLRRCTELLKEDAMKNMDDNLLAQCNEFTDLMVKDWKDCMGLDVARSRKRERLPLPTDLKKLQCYFDREMTVVIKKLAESNAASHWRRLSRLTLASIVLFNRGSSRKIDRMTMEDFENRESAEATLPEELEEKLSHLEKQSVGNLIRISIKEAPGKVVPILLKPMHMQAVKLMNEIRGSVGVVDNPYVFARPGGETPLRGDVIREFAHRAGLEQPNNITPSNLRKHVIITNHLTSYPTDPTDDQLPMDSIPKTEDDSYEQHDYSQYDMGDAHTGYDPDTENPYDTSLGETETKPDPSSLLDPSLENGIDQILADEARKDFNFRDNGSRYWFLEYNSSDFEYENGDDSDYEPASKRSRSRGSGKKRGTRKNSSTGAPQDNNLEIGEIGEIVDGAQGTGGSEFNGEKTKPQLDSKTRLYVRGKTRYTYCKWTSEEEAIVMNTMGQHFKKGTLPGKQECLKIMKEYPLLQKRKWEDVKYFVRNKMARMARENSALQNSVHEFCNATDISAAEIPHSSS